MIAAHQGLEEIFHGKRGWWTEPTYDMAEITWRLWHGLKMQMPMIEERLADRMLVAPSGGFMQLRSADSKGGERGEGLDFNIVNEAAHIRGLKDIWEQELRPTLSDKQGWALFISTPKGYNEFFDLYKRCDSNPAEWASFQYPTWDNPFIPVAEIESLRAEVATGGYSELVFRQEYGAEFVQLAGALFKREWFSKFLEEEPKDLRWVRGWDLAASTKVMADHTAGARIGYANDGTLIIADIVRGQWEWPDSIKIIGSTAQMDKSSTAQWVEDVGVQKGMLQLLQREPTLRGIGFWSATVAGDKLTRAQPWMARAAQGKIALVRGAWNKAFVDECCAFDPTQKDGKDDQIDAVSIAVQGLAEPKEMAMATLSHDVMDV